MRQRTLLLALPLAVGLAVTVVPGTASASVDGGVLLHVGGRQLGVGEVAAAGRLVDASCVFDTPVGITLSSLDGGHSGSARLSTDAACNLVVTAISGGTETARPVGVSRRQVQKYSREGMPGGIMPGLLGASGQSVGGSVTGALPDASVPSDLPSTEDRTQSYTGYTKQRFYDAAGAPQLEDQIAMDYTWNYGWGELQDVRVNFKESFCAVYNGVTSTLLVNDLSADDCLFDYPEWYRMKGMADSNGMTGSGHYFRTGVPYLTVDPMDLGETYAVANNRETGSCTYGSIPVGWTADCSYWRDEAVA